MEDKTIEIVRLDFSKTVVITDAEKYIDHSRTPTIRPVAKDKAAS